MGNFRHDYELDEDGRLRKKKRVADDGQRYSFTMMMMDAARFGFTPTFADGTPDHTNPHRKGYRFSDTDDPDRADAEQAYRERNRRMETAWRRKGEQQDETRDHRAAPRTRTLDELRAAADQAYAQRNRRMQNAWRNR
jgi:hypothetical protein